MERDYLELSNYVSITENHSNLFSPTDIVKICKRKNNPKRDFLFVNPLQGKHLHVEPSKTFSLFEELVKEIVNHVDAREKIVVIGFAETATAIGHYVASCLPNCIYYMQTTREIVSNAKSILEFKEEHSHATEQFLYGNIEKLQDCDRIIFVDDEISTGNTILNFIHALEGIGIHTQYGVASILNWQNESFTNKFLKLNIKTFCILRGEITDLRAIVPISIIETDTIYKKIKCHPNILKVHCDVSDFSKERTGSVPYNLEKFSKTIYHQILNVIVNYLPKENENILVLGTEEFMFSSMIFGKMLSENINVNVQFHATTRSPIEMSNMDSYVVKHRFSITSCYNKNRITYLYNLKNYDKVYVITDVIPINDFIIDISSALVSIGCQLDNIIFIVVKG